jgi:hypothetical protein
MSARENLVAGFGDVFSPLPETLVGRTERNAVGPNERPNRAGSK